MKLRHFTGLAAIVCMSLASCHPYNEGNQKNKPNKTTEKKELSPDEVKKKAAEEKKKKEDELKKKQEDSTTGSNTPGPGTVSPPPEPEPKPEVKSRTDYPFANKVPGQEGFVFSPYNNKVVDARDDQGNPIPSGTLVQDPTFPTSEKKFFRVP